MQYGSQDPLVEKSIGSGRASHQPMPLKDDREITSSTPICGRGANLRTRPRAEENAKYGYLRDKRESVGAKDTAAVTETV